MKYYVDMVHVSADISKIFEKELCNVISDYQNEGYFVEIQQGFNGKVFSAIVLAYVMKQNGDIIK